MRKLIFIALTSALISACDERTESNEAQAKYAELEKENKELRYLSESLKAELSEEINKNKLSGKTEHKPDEPIRNEPANCSTEKAVSSDFMPVQCHIIGWGSVANDPDAVYAMQNGNLEVYKATAEPKGDYKCTAYLNVSAMVNGSSKNFRATCPF